MPADFLDQLAPEGPRVLSYGGLSKPHLDLVKGFDRDLSVDHSPDLPPIRHCALNQPLSLINLHGFEELLDRDGSLARLAHDLRSARCSPKPWVLRERRRGRLTWPLETLPPGLGALISARMFDRLSRAVEFAGDFTCGSAFQGEHS